MEFRVYIIMILKFIGSDCCMIFSNVLLLICILVGICFSLEVLVIIVVGVIVVIVLEVFIIDVIVQLRVFDWFEKFKDCMFMMIKEYKIQFMKY